MIITDFAKAFDVVPNQRLLYKLNWYGIIGALPPSGSILSCQIVARE